MSNIPQGAVSIPAKSSLLVEVGAMQAYPKHTVKMDTGVQTGWVESIRRSVLGGGNLMLNTFSAAREAGWILLEHSVPGQLVEHLLQPGEVIRMKKGAFVACDPNIETQVAIKGIHEFFSNLGIIVLEGRTKNAQPGRIFLKSTEGIITPIKISPKNPVVIDNQRILAYTGDLSLQTILPGNSYTSWIFGGEGIATEFEGQGTVFLGSSNATSEESAAVAKAAAQRAVEAQAAIEKLVEEVLLRQGIKN